MSLDIAVAPDITVTFGVPVMIHMVPGAAPFNDGLRRVILARETADTGKSKSNAGGWHSDETLLNWPEPEIAALKGWIDDAVQKMCRLPLREKAGGLRLAYNATAWANVNRRGHYNTLHVHAGSHWSIVYYVATGEEEPGYQFNGLLELKDPRPAAVFGRCRPSCSGAASPSARSRACSSPSRPGSSIGCIRSSAAASASRSPSTSTSRATRSRLTDGRPSRRRSRAR